MPKAKMEEICKSISEAKAKIDAAATIPGETMQNYEYTVNDNSGEKFYECKRVEFQYRTYVNGRWSKTVNDKKDMFACPEYKSSFTLAGKAFTFPKKSFKVSRGDKKNTAFVFQKSSSSWKYDEPAYYATGLNYQN